MATWWQRSALRHLQGLTSSALRTDRAARAGPPGLTRSLREALAQRQQLLASRRAGLRIGQLQLSQRIEDDPGNDQAAASLVVGWDDVPGRSTRARCAEALFVGGHVVLPDLAFLDVGEAEFPVLVGIVDAFEEAFALLFLREVEKEFDDPGAVDPEMSFQVDDRPIPLLPDAVRVGRNIGQAFAAQNLRVNARDQHFLVVGAVEDADAPALRQIA